MTPNSATSSATVGEIERKTQERVIALFKNRLEFEYLGNWMDRPNNSNIEETWLRNFLFQKGYSADLVERTISTLNLVAGNQHMTLYNLNKEVYDLLRYGVKVKDELSDVTETVHLIDWATPTNNHFAIAEEVTVFGHYTKRPDIVLYINGIAMVVLELKRSTSDLSLGIRQNLDNQKRDFIESFFGTIQLVLAGNETQGLRYGVIETPEKFYLQWHEEQEVDRAVDENEGSLYRDLVHICSKVRLIEILRDFMVFDAGIKKTCRPHQYFGIKAAQDHVQRRQGGIIWHTQGSGKSLTMVWLARWIRENKRDARVLLITDRDELDKQIEKVFLGVKEQIVRAKSGKDLLALLNQNTDWLICSLIHKFGGAEEGNVDEYISELLNNAPSDFSAKGNLYIFVDECHRTQSGNLHRGMKALLPDAMIIGFTGTPLLARDKKSSLETFGPYIHTYRYDQAVRDGVVLDLRYEARDIDSRLASQAKIDQWFAAKTAGLTEIARAQLKQRWGTMQKLLSAKSRLELIVADIITDMGTRDRLLSGHGNALLVSDSVYNACRLYKLFIDNGFEKCAIITSYQPTADSIKGESTGEGTTEQLLKYDVYREMLANWFRQPEDDAAKRIEDFDREARKRFVDEPGQLKLLIVVDKLLTGFDAPSATYLYIDKPMRDHALFQAICRVNRLDAGNPEKDTADKEYGYIVDYRDLFKSLEKAVGDYTSNAFDGYEAGDVVGLLGDRLKKGRERLEEALEAVRVLCESVEQPRDTQAFLRFFGAADSHRPDVAREKEPLRIALYKLVAALVRAYANLAPEIVEAGYTTEQAEEIRRDVAYYEAIRSEVKLASGDAIDMKAYEPAMRQLLDMYVRAEDVNPISAFEDLTLFQLLVERGPQVVDSLPTGIREDEGAVAEAIENNVRKVITDEMPINPKYYEGMSTLLDALIELRRQQAIDYAAYLKQVAELARAVREPNVGGTYPASIRTNALRALYDNLDKDEDRACAVDRAVREAAMDGWKGNKVKEKLLRNAIRPHLRDEAEVDRILEIIRNQNEY